MSVYPCSRSVSSRVGACGRMPQHAECRVARQHAEAQLMRLRPMARCETKLGVDEVVGMRWRGLVVEPNV